ncbi:hypothetical protein ASPWEDRAFT_41484 [Aspergillus wentii DTO 134E9]|uniref:Uncharacterized protein n=1 Tax=Aspergillus wentii DTO 134E9 TaxID=1073089 RepID=A0A1L9RFH8_ASPWE|nr:uncharacterized protein ASPWEDRAFT_41484 [Aspergillus wentii DTO 134E9]KAI9925398.1 hypothetical protein MW887_005779 [Aspergillus wentii]OJJ33627.1 hypothetical protein ASPWEDRAFT_41484 [Aspergillus wentii DTO 134E9]
MVRFLRGALSLLFLLSIGLAVATPVSGESDALVPFPVDTSLVPINGLERRDTCSTVNAVVDKIGTSTEIIAYFSTGYFSTLWVCTRNNAHDCNTMATAVGSSFVSISYIAGRVWGGKSVTKRDSNDTLAGYLETAFRSGGEVFEAIQDTTHTLQARSDSGYGELPVEMASIRNWAYNGTLVNFDIHDFGNGNGHILLPLDGIGAHSLNGTTLNRRAVGKAPGFKISYTTRMESKLTNGHRVDMANAMASDWASRANSNNKMSSYIGLWKTGHSANFYFRVIPESQDFGTNYEPVNVCGQMAQFL